MSIIQSVTMRLNGHHAEGMDIEHYLDAAQYEGNLDHAMCVSRNSVVEVDIELKNGEGAWVVGPDYVSVLEYVRNTWPHLGHELLDIPYETLKAIEDSTTHRFDIHYTFINEADPRYLMAGGIRVMDLFPADGIQQILHEASLAGYVALVEGEGSYFFSTNLPANLELAVEEMRVNGVTEEQGEN